ncbi:MAG TPA: prepilin-type N-terminal cleavage/methylation domain-containing protein [Terriglobales bacterium]|nr:prepilin-type N-terminal cleavage/methylation domain-containing protein [Terriglobales bacterium]
MKLARKRKTNTGFTLLEVLIASTILAVVAVGVLGLFSVSVLRNASAGDHGTRVTEYAQDKMEQLMALTFSDIASDVTKSPTYPTGGIGLTAGGGVNPTSPVTNYVDYVMNDGTPSQTNTGAAYIREWKITDDVSGAATLKTITVRVQKIKETKGEVVPYTLLVSQKSSN